LARKSGKVSANNNAKDASFQLVRLNDQINALKKQLQNEQFNNEENVVNLQKSQLVRIRFSSFSCANGYFFLNFFFFFFFSQQQRCTELQEKLETLQGELDRLLTSKQDLLAQKAVSDMRVKQLESEQEALGNDVSHSQNLSILFY
jgi:DNA repair exonuclease SbcCD ATPase subunit